MSMAFRSLPPPSHFSPWFKHLLRDSNKYFCYFITKVFHKSISSRCFPYLFLASALTSSKHVFSVGLSVAILKSFRLSVQFSSVAQSCPTLCNPMNRSTSGLPVHHQLPEFTQTHGHWVSDAIQPSHPLSSPSPPAPNPSQHQSLFQWVNSSHEVAKVLEFQL